MSEMWWQGLHHHKSLCGLQRSRTSQAEEASYNPCACRWATAWQMGHCLADGPALCTCCLHDCTARHKALDAPAEGRARLLCTHHLYNVPTLFLSWDTAAPVPVFCSLSLLSSCSEDQHEQETSYYMVIPVNPSTQATKAGEVQVCLRSIARSSSPKQKRKPGQVGFPG